MRLREFDFVGGNLVVKKYPFIEFDNIDNNIMDEMDKQIEINVKLLENNINQIIKKINAIDKLSDYYYYKDNIKLICDNEEKIILENNYIVRNPIKKYYLIINLGSETNDEIVFEINKYFKYNSQKLSNRYGCILSSKNINYNYTCLSKKSKYIIIDLLCVNKNTQNIFIKLRDNVLYSIRLLNVRHYDGLLKTFLEFRERNKYMDDDIIVYNDENCVGDEFSIMVDIYYNKCISILELEKYIDIINYYCVGWENILISELGYEQHIGDDILIFYDENNYKLISEFLTKYLPKYVSFDMIYDKDDNNILNLVVDKKKIEFVEKFKNFIDDNNIVDKMIKKIKIIRLPINDVSSHYELKRIYGFFYMEN